MVCRKINSMEVRFRLTSSRDSGIQLKQDGGVNAMSDVLPRSVKQKLSCIVG